MSDAPVTPFAHLFARAIVACASSPLPAEGVPEWVHLLPAAQGTVRTHDGRGPYRVVDLAQIIKASLKADPRDQSGLIIDENHSSDIAAPLGQPSPARGRIFEMEARPDGVWGRVEWTPSGRALMEDRAYRGISPVITYDPKSGVVHSILRAGLVNYPNLRGLTALNSEVQMDVQRLAAALSLAETATIDEILSAITALQADRSTTATAMQSSEQQLVAMQAEVTTLTAAHNSLLTSHTALQTQIRREKAEAFVDAAIAQARPGIKPRRDYYIARHMEDPAETEASVNAISPWVTDRRSAPAQIPADGPGSADLTALNAEQQGRVLHDRASAWQSQQKAVGISVSLFDAITHVKKDMSL